MAATWTAVRWADARQVLHFMGQNDSEPLAEQPAAHFHALIGDGPQHDALDFLGHALPRLECIGWAARFLARVAASDALHPRDRQALDAALRWLDEPVDQWRRAAHEISDMASDGGAEQLLGMAVFLSGGSIAPVDAAPVLPPDFACNRIATSAVKVAVFRAARQGRDATEKRLQMAIELGEAFAEQGMEAFARA